MSFLKIFDNIDLVPQQWQEGGDTHYYTFNPTIIKIHEGYAMCYRLVSSTNLLRKLATCHLSNKFEIIPGTVTPLSDLIEFAVPEDFGAGETIFHADARYFFLKGKYYISFNNGKTSKPNHQFLIEMKSTGLIPDGKAREIIINDTRQAVEKNWMFFEIDGRVFSIYSITPHRILDVDLSNADYVFCEEAYSSKWENQYEEIFGELRSSVTPILMNDRYLTLFHSRYPMPVGVHYVCGFYEFECKPPFRVLRYSAYPFDLPASKSKYTMKALHKVVSECVYPCGLVKLEKELIVSYGILNEKVAIASLDIEKINDSLIPVVQPVQKAVDKKEEFHVNQNKHQQQKLMIPMFWWDAKGWKYGGKEAQRIFKTGNVGDTFAPEIVDKLAGIKVRQPLEDEIKLISLGSLIHRAGNDDIIWGTGIKGNMMHLKEGVDRLRVFAVRGPHTLDFLKQKNIDVSKVSEFFDPGCLVSFMFQDMIATLNVEKNHGFGKFRIIPHFRDDVYIRRKYYKYWNNLISADMYCFDLIKKLIGAEMVISSSLHGIIFAESLCIPAYWLKSQGGENPLKFYDYYYGTGRYNVKCFESIEDAFKSEPMPLPVFNYEAYLKTFPQKEILSLANFGNTVKNTNAHLDDHSMFNPFKFLKSIFKKQKQ